MVVLSIQLDPQEIEQAELSFPCVLIKSSSVDSSTTPQVITIQITVPHYKTNEEKESNQADYQNFISVGIVLSVSSKKKENEQVTLKELVVTSSSPEKSSVNENENENDDENNKNNNNLLLLSEENCQVLQRMYEKILLSASETGDDDNYLSFSLVPTSSNTKLFLSTNGALFTLIVQMVTDATDSQLSETLAAHQITTSNTSSTSQQMKKMNSTFVTSSVALSTTNNNNGFAKNNSSDSNSASSNTTPVQSPNQSKPNNNNSEFPLQSIKNNLNGKLIPTSLNHNINNNNNNNSKGTGSSDATTTTTNNNNVPLAIRNSLAINNFTKILRVRICKIDHMRNEKMYLGNISENFETLKVDPISTYFENEGLLGVMTINDPNSPRVLLCMISLVFMNLSSSNQIQNNNNSFISSSSIQNNINNIDSSSSSSAIQCAGSYLIKELRLNVTDVDSHGRKCRERMMRDLGGWNIGIESNNTNNNTNTSSSSSAAASLLLNSNFYCNHPSIVGTAPSTPVNNTNLVSEYYKMFWSSEPFKKMTPTSREEGIAIIKKFFVEPFAAASNNNNNNFVYIANDILHDKNLWDHV